MFKFINVIPVTSVVLLSVLWISCGTQEPNVDSKILDASAKRFSELASLAQLDENLPSYQDVDQDMAHYYVGLTPREMALGLSKETVETPELSTRLFDIAQDELPLFLEKTGYQSIQVELWPTTDGYGQMTWQVARYRSQTNDPWLWANSDFVNNRRGKYARQGVGILYPSIMDPTNVDDREVIFNQSPADAKSRGDQGKGLSVGSLYERPVFESMVWADQDLEFTFGGWKKIRYARTYWDYCSKSGKCKAIHMAPPSRLNDKPFVFYVRVNKSGVKFETEINWIKENRSPAKIHPIASVKLDYPDNLSETYIKYLRQLTGEIPIHDRDGNVVDFGKQSAFQKDNQLDGTLDFLERLHRSWGYGVRKGFEIERQPLQWNGTSHANLIVRIRGRLGDSKPIVVGSTHYDKAIAEDLYADSRWQTLISNPGADDATSGVAMLLVAAEMLAKRYKNNPPEYTIELVHFTGEEYPAGTVGSRYYVAQLLKNKKDVRANINLDMNGIRNKNDTIYQISPGFSKTSWNLAELAYSIAAIHGGGWTPKVRFPSTKESFLGQTDASIFDWMGYPTILISEHINMIKRDNYYYHQSTDVAENIARDVEYPLAQLRVFVEMLVRSSEVFR